MALQRFLSMAQAATRKMEPNFMADVLPVARYWMNVGYRVGFPGASLFVNVPGMASGL